MKHLLTALLVLLIATTASAQFVDNTMGMFFSPDEFVVENTNFDTAGAPFQAYIVLLNGNMVAVGAYEVGIEISDPSVFILGASGPSGWTNFGDNLNHLAGYTVPLPLPSGDAVLCTLDLLYTGVDTVEIFFGPSEPSSVDGAGPAVADGVNPDILYVCEYTSGSTHDGLVATLNGEGIDGGGCPAVEMQTLSGVKALFE